MLVTTTFFNQPTSILLEGERPMHGETGNGVSSLAVRCFTRRALHASGHIRTVSAVRNSMRRGLGCAGRASVGVAILTTLFTWMHALQETQRCTAILKSV